jgi:F-type H+-transporting ATPase subunit b
VIPDLSVVVVMAFVLLLVVLMDRLLLRPLTQVMDQREAAIRSAHQLAETSRLKAQAAADEFDVTTRQARGEVYQQMDEKRRAALDRRAGVLAATRSEVEQATRQATGRLSDQAAAARTQLDRDADSLATTIVERVLGRKA